MRASALRSAREAVASLSDEVAGNARACLGQELRGASAGARAVEAGFAALAAAVKDLGSLAGWLATSESCLKQTVTALDAVSLEVVFTEDAPEARVAHAAVSAGGCSVLMYGGTNMLHPPAYDDCLVFDAGSKQW